MKTGLKRCFVDLIASDSRPVRDGVILQHGNSPVRFVTSVELVPSLHRPAALGFVKAEFASPGRYLFAETRSAPTLLTVREFPLVQHKYFR